MAGQLRDNRMLGPGGAPTRATSLPTDGKERKKFPVGSGVLDYFPDALVAVAGVSWQGNEQHNPGQSLRWTRGKSSDHSDTMMRHYLQRGTIDVDGIRHSAKMVWRALALLQEEIEAEVAFEPQQLEGNQFYRPTTIVPPKGFPDSIEETIEGDLQNYINSKL